MADGGVRRQQHLEPAVEAEPVDGVGADPAPDAIRRFEDDAPAAELVQPPRAGQAGDAAADDHDGRLGHPPPV